MLDRIAEFFIFGFVPLVVGVLAVPDLSIEVDDLDEVHRKLVQAGMAIEYGPVSEPWGVRRFYVRDPFGRLLNILSHD